LIVNIFIKYYAQYGGAERIAFRFAEYLTKNNIEVRIYCGKNKIESDLPYPVTELGLGSSRYAKAKDFAEKGARLASTLEGVIFSFERIENAHIFRPGGGVHRFFTQYTMLGLSGWERFRKTIKRKLDRVNKLNPILEKKAFNSPSLKFIIANSNRMKREIVEDYPEVTDLVHVIHNGVNKTMFNPARRDELRESSDVIRVGLATSNFQRKGLPQLIKALSLLPEKYHLYVAGGRNPENYQKLAEEMNVGKRITFLGKVTEMDKFYANLDVFCLPTFFDGFANVVSEAIASGIPVACSIYSGSDEIIEEGVNGYVFKEVEPLQISEAIAAASKISIQDFSHYVSTDEEVFRKYLDLCEKVIL